MRTSKLYEILCWIHIAFYTSILCFGVIILSGTLLMLPALAVTFKFGKEIIYKEFDIYDNILKKFFNEFKQNIKLLKYIYLNIIMIINIVAIYLNLHSNNPIFAIISIAIVSFLLVFILYLVNYHTFIKKEIYLPEVILFMFINPFSLLMLFSLMSLALIFLNDTILLGLILCGALGLFIMQLVIFVQVLYYKKRFDLIDENDRKFLNLVDNIRKSGN